MSDADWNSSEDGEFNTVGTIQKSKRRKVLRNRRAKAVSTRSEEPTISEWSIDPLLETLHEKTAAGWGDVRNSFDKMIESLLPELLQGEIDFFLAQEGREKEENSSPTSHLLQAVQAYESNAAEFPDSVIARLIHAKARIHSRLLRRVVLDRTPSYMASGSITPLRPSRLSAVNPAVLDALNAIKTTSYRSSFLSRLQGFSFDHPNKVIAVDWEIRTPWMELMADIREHHSLAHPEREQVVEITAPVVYCTLERCHLDQVHNLLGRVFWEGIDVTDSLEYTPEKCTVVALYKRLVIGAAFLSSPQETYITYLAVRSGWDNSQIATSMLYHLINLNPHKDVTLHVSINNPAMLLYNRFGFKAEEFIVGFYEDYLDAHSLQSKNAFRLRLRQH